MATLITPEFEDAIVRDLQTMSREDLVKMCRQQVRVIARLMASHHDMTKFMEIMAEKFNEAGATYGQDLKSISAEMAGVRKGATRQ